MMLDAISFSFPIRARICGRLQALGYDLLEFGTIKFIDIVLMQVKMMVVLGD